MPPRIVKKTIKKNELPDTIRPLAFHGLHLDKISSSEYATDCPFCSKEEKLSVNIKSGKWRCLLCDEKGGLSAFLQKLWELSKQQTTEDHLGKLAADRGVYTETLDYWGVVKSALTGEWLLPAYALDKKHVLYIKQLYRYVKTPKGMALMATPTRGHAMFGLDLFEKKKSDIIVTEGPWDAMKLEESLQETKSQGEKINVIGNPGCNVFVPGILKLAHKKTITIAYDNDHPREHPTTGAYLPPVGFAGAKRLASKLQNSTTTSVNYLCWGEDGYDENRKNGFDVRDLLESLEIEEGLTKFFSLIKSCPEEWQNEVEESESGLTPINCSKWSELRKSWKEALQWSEGLDYALAVMLACGASTNSVGDQLWIKVVGPPSCGKSTLCEAISVSKKYVLAKSTIRGFHSGYSAGNGDSSLIPLIMGKTLVTKDGDTLLQSPNLNQILAEARDVYDSVSRTHYRNSVGKDYEGIRMTWLLCGTESLRDIDSSELGQRFLDCVIMEKITDEEEDPILWRKANAAASHVDTPVGNDLSTHQDPKMTKAMQLTGGYLEWLRDNAHQQLSSIEFSDTAKKECITLGKFVAYMRARPNKERPEGASREMAARLVSQHVRLAKCMALVMQRDSVDSIVLSRVRRTAFDTARGNVLTIIRSIYDSGDNGLPTTAINVDINLKKEELEKLLRFLRDIDVLELVVKKYKRVYRLTESLNTLCTKVRI